MPIVGSTHPEYLEKMCQSLQQAITQTGPLLEPDGEDVDTLLHNANAAMQAADEMRRNTGQFYSQSMNVALAERLSLESNLRKTLERDEFLLFYHPQAPSAPGTSQESKP